MKEPLVCNPSRQVFESTDSESETENENQEKGEEKEGERRTNHAEVGINEENTDKGKQNVEQLKNFEQENERETEMVSGFTVPKTLGFQTPSDKRGETTNLNTNTRGFKLPADRRADLDDGETQVMSGNEEARTFQQATDKRCDFIWNSNLPTQCPSSQEFQLALEV